MIEYTVKVYDDGHKEWYLNGNRHREDGPAVKCSDGYKEWWINGNLHREDGPAIEGANGYKSWYLNGEELTKKEFKNKIKKKKKIIIEISEELWKSFKESLDN